MILDHIALHVKKHIIKKIHIYEKIIKKKKKM